MYSFKEFIHVLWLRRKAIAVLTLCFMAIGCAGFVFLKGFHYTNQVSFLLPATDPVLDENAQEDKQEIDNKIISSNIKLIETYKEMVKSEPLLQLMQADNPHQSKQSLFNSMTVSNSFNSQIFNVSIKTNSPELSRKIALSLSEHYPKLVEMSGLPRKVFILSAQSAQTIRTPSFSKLLLGIWFASFMVSTSLSFMWSYHYRRKYIKTPEGVHELIETESIGTIDFYEISKLKVEEHN